MEISRFSVFKIGNEFINILISVNSGYLYKKFIILWHNYPEIKTSQENFLSVVGGNNHPPPPPTSQYYNLL